MMLWITSIIYLFLFVYIRLWRLEGKCTIQDTDESHFNKEKRKKSDTGFQYHTPKKTSKQNLPSGKAKEMCEWVWLWNWFKGPQSSYENKWLKVSWSCGVNWWVTVLRQWVYCWSQSVSVKPAWPKDQLAALVQAWRCKLHEVTRASERSDISRLENPHQDNVVRGVIDQVDDS